MRLPRLCFVNEPRYSRRYGRRYNRFPDITNLPRSRVELIIDTMLRPGLLSLIASALLVLGLERSASSQIFITEILYNAEPVNTGGEFVELHNSGKEAVDVGNWVLVDAVNYSFPSGTTIEPGAYVVIARNATEAAEFYGVEILGEYAGALSNGSDSVILQDDSIPRRIIDSVTYADVAPWPLAAGSFCARSASGVRSVCDPSVIVL